MQPMPGLKATRCTPPGHPTWLQLPAPHMAPSSRVMLTQELKLGPGLSVLPAGLS